MLGKVNTPRIAAGGQMTADREERDKGGGIDMQSRLGRRAALQLLALGAGAGLVFSEGRRRTKLYVTNSLGDDITVIDLENLKVIGDLRVGKHPHGVAAREDGRLLFTTIESEKDLKVIDTSTGKVTDTIPLGGEPNQCAVTPNGRFVAVPIRDGNSVELIDMDQKRVVKILPVKVPHNCFNAGNNEHMFVTSMGDDRVYVVDLQTMSYIAELPVGGIPRPIAVSRDEKTMYVALSDFHGFVIVDVPQRRVIQRVELPPGPHNTNPLEPHTETHGLALSPQGRALWVTSLGDDSMYVFDTATKQLSPKIPVGHSPNWVTFSPDGQYCCVSNTGSNDCSVISARGRHEIGRIKVGEAPKRLLAVSVPPP